MEDHTDKEYMEVVRLNDERESHWRMIFEDNEGDIDDDK